MNINYLILMELYFLCKVRNSNHIQHKYLLILFFDNQLKRADAIRLGTEWRINNLSVRGGYVYEQSPFINSISSDNLESYSLGLGYNFGNVKLNLSYRKSNKTDQYDFYPQYSEVEATQLNINNTIITIGFSANI